MLYDLRKLKKLTVLGHGILDGTVLSGTLFILRGVAKMSCYVLYLYTQYT